jgi:hypothetical protein
MIVTDEIAKLKELCFHLKALGHDESVAIIERHLLTAAPSEARDDDEAAKTMREALETIANMPPRLTIDQLIDEHSEMRLVARRALDVVDLCKMSTSAYVPGVPADLLEADYRAKLVAPPEARASAEPLDRAPRISISNWIKYAIDSLNGYQRDLGADLPDDHEIGRIEDSRDTPSFRLRVGHIRQLHALFKKTEAMAPSEARVSEAMVEDGLNGCDPTAFENCTPDGKRRIVRQIIEASRAALSAAAGEE